MAFEAEMTISDDYHLDENNERNAVLGQIFCREFTICHCFNEPCNSEKFDFDKWIEIKRFKYCVKFT